MAKLEHTRFKYNGDFIGVIDWLNKGDYKFKASISTYSAIIEFDGYKEMYVTNLMSERVFKAFNMIKSDLKRDEVSVVLSDLKDNIEERNNRYYNIKYKGDKFYKNAVCVDLNSAYLQALYNYGLIRERTFKYINNCLNKFDRLACVGMLASKKNILHFKNGQMQQEYVDESPLRFVFNALIQSVNEVMNKIADHFFNDFIAYWVDGIYMSNEYMAWDIEEMFNDYGFPAKTEELTNFNISYRFEHYQLDFKKDNKDKTLLIPNEDVAKERKRLLNQGLKRLRLTNAHVTDVEDIWKPKHYKLGRLFD